MNPFDWYAFPPYVLEVVEKAKLWHESKHWYKSKHIPWTRGWLMHGTPGTGKSLLLKCVAQYLDLPVFVFDLCSMNNEEFVTFWEQSCEESPCMILFEDFDAVFHGRENITEQDQKLSFDCILNCISGINNAEGIFLAVTTNNVEHIDAALGGEGNGISSRPGRIDDVIELKNMDEACRRIMAGKLVAPHLINSVMQATVDKTAAQFIEVCTQHALTNKFTKLTKAS
jgi:SpoVK/Ycf46/Vps4 family AAA+-type ATPase